MNVRNETENCRTAKPSFTVDGSASSAFDAGSSSFRIDKDGKASDMDPSSVMSGDGCNPVNRDDEMERAHDGEGLSFPGILPGVLPGTVSDGFPGSVPPAYFPGSFPGAGPFVQ